eukprot:Clim_evm36s148 gene=Clim_evmTU36s148
MTGPGQQFPGSRAVRNSHWWSIKWLLILLSWFQLVCGQEVTQVGSGNLTYVDLGFPIEDELVSTIGIRFALDVPVELGTVAIEAIMAFAGEAPYINLIPFEDPLFTEILPLSKWQYLYSVNRGDISVEAPAEGDLYFLVLPSNAPITFDLNGQPILTASNLLIFGKNAPNGQTDYNELEDLISYVSGNPDRYPMLWNFMEEYLQEGEYSVLSNVITCSRFAFRVPNEIQCQICPDDRVNVDGTPTGCVCSVNTYTTPANTCEPCIQGELCLSANLTAPLIAPGYWGEVTNESYGDLFENSTQQLFQCRNQRFCQGGNALGESNNCIDGHTGFLCEECETEYHRVRNSCQKCSLQTLRVVGGIVVCLLAAFALYALPWLYNTSPSFILLMQFLQFNALLYQLRIDLFNDASLDAIGSVVLFNPQLSLIGCHFGDGVEVFVLAQLVIFALIIMIQVTILLCANTMNRLLDFWVAKVHNRKDRAAEARAACSPGGDPDCLEAIPDTEDGGSSSSPVEQIHRTTNGTEVKFARDTKDDRSMSTSSTSDTSSKIEKPNSVRERRRVPPIANMPRRRQSNSDSSNGIPAAGTARQAASQTGDRPPEPERRHSPDIILLSYQTIFVTLELMYYPLVAAAYLSFACRSVISVPDGVDVRFINTDVTQACENASSGAMLAVSLLTLLLYGGGWPLLEYVCYVWAKHAGEKTLKEAFKSWWRRVLPKRQKKDSDDRDDADGNHDGDQGHDQSVESDLPLPMPELTDSIRVTQPPQSASAGIRLDGPAMNGPVAGRRELINRTAPWTREGGSTGEHVLHRSGSRSSGTPNGSVSGALAATGSSVMPSTTLPVETSVTAPNTGVRRDWDNPPDGWSTAVLKPAMSRFREGQEYKLFFFYLRACAVSTCLALIREEGYSAIITAGALLLISAVELVDKPYRSQLHHILALIMTYSSSFILIIGIAILSRDNAAPKFGDVNYGILLAVVATLLLGVIADFVYWFNPKWDFYGLMQPPPVRRARVPGEYPAEADRASVEGLPVPYSVGADLSLHNPPQSALTVHSANSPPPIANLDRHQAVRTEVDCQTLQRLKRKGIDLWEPVDVDHVYPYFSVMDTTSSSLSQSSSGSSGHGRC